MTQERTPGFNISARKGFHITFENGWTVSVQFGYGNYGSNYDWPGDNPSDPLSRHEGPVPKAATAEVAAWPAEGEWLVFDGDTVAGHYTPAQVLELMNRVSAFPNSASGER